MTAARAIRRRKEALLRNPSVEGAMEFWPWHLAGAPKQPDVPLASLHKARLKWERATPAMAAESRAWLAEHGYREDIDLPMMNQ